MLRNCERKFQKKVTIPETTGAATVETTFPPAETAAPPIVVATVPTAPTAAPPTVPTTPPTAPPDKER